MPGLLMDINITILKTAKLKLQLLNTGNAETLFLLSTLHLLFSPETPLFASYPTSPHFPLNIVK